jgi:hypothetical protein
LFDSKIIYLINYYYHKLFAKYLILFIFIQKKAFDV